MLTRVVLGLILGVAVATVPIAAGQQPAAPAAAAKAAPAAAPYKVPMTSWGDPDLQGTWDYKSITPLERNASLGDRQFYTDAEIKEMEGRAGRRMDEPPPANERAGTIHAAYWTDPGRLVDESRRTSLIIDPPNGRIPPTVAGRRGGAPVPPPGEEENPAAGAGARAGGAGRAGAAGRAGGGGGRGNRADSWLDRSSLERCITWGLPTALLPGLYNNNIQIVQSPTFVTITHEMVHDTRVIPFGNQPLQSNKALASWLGHSVARWEGDTLVVETSNFNGRAGYRGATTNLHLTERYRRVGPNKVDFRLTVEDKTVWTAPWTVALTMRTSEGPLFEYACHEGNYGLRNILEVARDEEKAAAAEAAKGK
jgi:hypothetical protein